MFMSIESQTFLNNSSYFFSVINFKLFSRLEVEGGFCFEFMFLSGEDTYPEPSACAVGWPVPFLTAFISLVLPPGTHLLLGELIIYRY